MITFELFHIISIIHNNIVIVCFVFQYSNEQEAELAQQMVEVLAPDRWVWYDRNVCSVKNRHITFYTILLLYKSYLSRKDQIMYSHIFASCWGGQ